MDLLGNLPPRSIVKAEVLKRTKERILRGDLGSLTLKDIKEAIWIQERNAHHAERLSKVTDEELTILDEITRKCAI